MSAHERNEDSRTPSTTTTVLDIEEESSNGADRKANTDSGFHEEEYSTPTPSTSGGKRHYHHTRRRPTPPPQDDDEKYDDKNQHPRHPSHDSLMSRFSDLQDYNSINFDYGSNSSESSASVESVENIEPSPNQQRNYVRKLGKKLAPAPLTPPPTSCGLDGVATTTTPKEYEFPSDTELSEIIAIMSGIASPRKQNGKVFHGKATLRTHDEDGEEAIHSFIEPTPPPPPPPPAHSQPRLRRGESLNLYEKKPHHSGVMNGNAGGVSNGNIPNGSVSRRYLPKQGKSLDAVSVSGSERGLNDLNRSKNQSMNSLNSILMASKAGTLPNMPKNKKKKVKKKAPPPPRRDDGEDPGEVEFKNKLSWKQRLKLSLTMVVSVLLILSSSSLLFIVPIVVDPILVGLEAKFSNAPATCRTVNKRNGSGSFDCTTPSCREGCTADLMFCYFIDVEYQIGVYNTSAKSLLNNNYLSYNHSELAAANTDDGPSQNDSSLLPSSTGIHFESKSVEIDTTRVEPSSPPGKRQGGILLVNPSGCGYPPEINCSEFERKFGAINFTFPCYYSSQNESIVVPFYSRDMEILILSISLIIPCGSSLVLSCFLYLLLKWKPNPYQRKRKKKVKEKEEDPPVNSDPKLRKDQNGTNEDSLRLNLKPNGTLPKANSALSNIMGDLTGLTANNVMKMHNYTKFHSSLSNPNSAVNSRQVSRGDSLEVELAKIEEQHERQAAEKLSNKTSSSTSVQREGSKRSRGSEALNNDNYNFNHVKSSKYNEKDFVGGHLLSNGHTPKDLSPDTNDQDSLLPNHTPVSSSDWRTENADLHSRKGSEISMGKSSRAGPLRTPQVSSTSKFMRKTRNSIDSIDSLESVKTISFGKL